MTPGEFIATFLPNSNEEWGKIISGLESGQMITLASIGFIYNHFEEALENFTNKICEKQKEICASDVELYLSVDGEPNPKDLAEIINGSFTPKIEDL